MKRVLPWLVRWAHHAGATHFYPALAALVSPVQNMSAMSRMLYFHIVLFKEDFCKKEFLITHKYYNYKHIILVFF
jgi:hypothetical protein